MKTTVFENRYNITFAEIVTVCKTESTMVKAAESVNIPYKTFLRVTKRLGCYNPNMGGKGLPGKSPKSKIPLIEILEGLHPSYDSKKIRIRLIQEKLKEAKCERCQLTEWNGELIPLELHHIDGNNSNHKYLNLEILCPNCHSLTETHSTNKITKSRTSI